VVGGARVADVMTTMPIQVRPSAPVSEVAQLMREQDIGAVIVAVDGRVQGLVTDRDLVVRVLADERGPTTQVGAACTAVPVTVAAEAPVDEAVGLMRAYKIRRLPVVADGVAVGILSLGDLAEYEEPGSVLGDISAAEPNN
jgi:CBS domain-containing protein